MGNLKSLILPLPSYFLNGALQIFRKEQCFIVGSRDSFHLIKKYKLYVDFFFRKSNYERLCFISFIIAPVLQGSRGFSRLMCVSLLSSLSSQPTEPSELSSRLDPTSQPGREAWTSPPARDRAGLSPGSVASRQLYTPSGLSPPGLDGLFWICFWIRYISYFIFSSTEQSFAWYARVLQIHICVH